MDLASIKAPTLVLANKPDSCASSPASNAEKVVKMLTGSPAAAVKVYGDEDPGSDSCKWSGPHYFADFQDKVEADIVAFIQAKSK